MPLSISCLLVTVPATAWIVFSIASTPERLSPGFAFVSLLLLTSIMIAAISAAQKAYNSPKMNSPNNTHPNANDLEVDEKTESKILQLAKLHNGRLTSTHLAMDSQLTIEQATQILTNFEQRSIVYSEITLHGGTEYVFPDLLKPTDQSADLEHFDNQILDFERSNKVAKAHAEHAEHAESTHKN